MPSSLIFAGLVVLWLLILVPAVARRRQEVERPSEAALAGRVLERPVRHRSLEVAMDTDDERDELATTGGAAARLRACLDGLRVHPEAMRRNLGTATPDVGHAVDLVDRVLEGR
ncbi:hypothetical protein [Pseudonocardia pini]|uniref:hypothetical protein n=1 Tax=Pseudonocardia pini TaxID=2758030 RepID=UPI0015F00BA7|nr:hypothetical protein [Pseudonocardia pini]